MQNIFISYSHQDKESMELLKSHLVTLKRQRLVASWTDQELLPGDILDEQIQENLHKADIVLFLVSVHFLNSVYCYTKELEKSIENKGILKQAIIPIILRHCDWKDGLINTFSCITYNDKPITAHSDQDEAWLHVVNKIKKRIEDIEVKKKYNNGCLAVKKDFYDNLGDTEIQFAHRHKDEINLYDIFVYPQIQEIQSEIDTISIPLDSEKHLSSEELPLKTIVIGSSQSGKTSLGKILFKKYHDEKQLPVIFESEIITSSNADKILEKAISRQYSLENISDFTENKCNKIAIIDDFQKVTLNEKAQNKFLENINVLFDKIIIFSDNIARYTTSSFFNIRDYKSYEILPFGSKLKNRLIEKWNSLGVEESIGLNDLHIQGNITRQHVDSIVRKNIIEPKPIYILTVLQSIESAKPSDFSLTSYGHCYQYLITQNFEKSKISGKELDTYFNYLTAIAYFMYSRKEYGLDENSLKFFQKEYSSKHFIMSHDVVLNNLIKAKILQDVSRKISFRYKYIYFFYVAKYLAENLSDTKTKDNICVLCEKIHLENNANILIFLTHHSKDASIIEDIFLYISEIFSDTPQVILNQEDTACLQEFMDLIPEKVHREKNVSEERDLYFDRQDKATNLSQKESSREIKDEDESRFKNDALLNTYKSLRAIDIVGQIIRNRYGSLTLDQLVTLGTTGVSICFRLLKFYLTITEYAQKEVVDFISEIVSKDKTKKDEYVIKEAKKIFLALNYGVSFGIIHKTAQSIGSEAIVSLLPELKKELGDSPAFNLLTIAIRLSFKSEIPKSEINRLYDELNEIPITRRLLRDTILRHASLHELDYKDRQWVNNKFKVPIKNQLLQQKQAYH